MAYRFIIFKKGLDFATIYLNRPRALNALHGDMIEELCQAIHLSAEDAEIKALILTGTGRSFCLGADVSAFAPESGNPDGDSTPRLLKKSQKINGLLAGMGTATIAAINGLATGLGLDLCLACDLRIAAERAKLSEAFISMGLIPDGGGTFSLPRLVGLARAAEMILLGEPITAMEALKIGLINRVVRIQDLEKTARDWAGKIAQGPFPATALAKKALWQNLNDNLAAALKREAGYQEICLASDAHKKAVRAFLARRGQRTAHGEPPNP